MDEEVLIELAQVTGDTAVPFAPMQTGLLVVMGWCLRPTWVAGHGWSTPGCSQAPELCLGTCPPHTTKGPAMMSSLFFLPFFLSLNLDSYFPCQRKRIFQNIQLPVILSGRSKALAGRLVIKNKYSCMKLLKIWIKVQAGRQGVGTLSGPPRLLLRVTLGWGPAQSTLTAAVTAHRFEDWPTLCAPSLWDAYTVRDRPWPAPPSPGCGLLEPQSPPDSTKQRLQRERACRCSAILIFILTFFPFSLCPFACISLCGHKNSTQFNDRS